jgi:hypothetical protein
VSVSPSTISEASESTPAVITFTRDITDGSLTVNYQLSGTATPGDDFSGVGSESTGSVVFNDGSSTATISLYPVDDEDDDDGEEVWVDLWGGQGYTIGSSAFAAILIEDNDGSSSAVTPTVMAVALDGVISESNPSTGGRFAVLRNTTVGSLTVNFLLDGSATFDVDYTGPSSSQGSVVIPDGASYATVTVFPVDDEADDPYEAILLEIDSGAGYSIGEFFQAFIAIVDNDQSGGGLPPDANDDLLSVLEGSILEFWPVDLLDNDTDPEDDSIQFVAIETQPSYGQLSANGTGGWEYTPNTSFSGIDI